MTPPRLSRLVVAALLSGALPAIPANESAVAVPGGTPVSLGGGFAPVAAARVADSTTGVGVPKSKLGAGATLNVNLTGVAGIPANGVGAVVVRITGVKPTSTTAVTVWPSGVARPTTPTLLAASGKTVTQMTVVAPGAGGAISIHNLKGKTNVTIDVLGWFPDGSGFEPVTAARLADTSTGLGVPKAKLSTNGVVTVPTTGHGGLPASGVGVVVLRVAGVKPSSSTQLTVWPTGTTRPVVASVIVAAGATTGNLVMVAPGTDGKVSIHNLKGKTNATLDVIGWFPASTGFEPVVPARLVDTATGFGAAKAKVPANGTLSIAVLGANGVPGTGVAAVALNVTGIKPSSTTQLTAWPAGAVRPAPATLAVAAGATVSSMVVVAPGADGKVSIHNLKGKTNLTVDVVGWFPDDGDNVLDAVLAPGTVLLGTGDVVSVTGNSEVGGSVVIGPVASVPEVGGHLVVTAQALAPQGVVGLVTTVADGPGANRTITFDPTTLADAFSDLDLDVHESWPQNASVGSTDAQETRPQQGVASCDLDGGVNVTRDISFTISNTDYELDLFDRHLRMLIQGNVNLTLSLTVEGVWSCTFEFLTLTVVAGYFTVDITPKFSISVSGAVTSSVSAGVPVSVGFDATGGDVTNLSHASLDASGSIDSDVSVTLTATPSVQLAVKVFGLGGGGMELGVPFIGKVQPLDIPCATIKTRVDLTFQILVGRFSVEWEIDLGTYETEERTIYERRDGCPAQGQMWTGEIHWDMHLSSSGDEHTWDEDITYTLLRPASKSGVDGASSYPAAISGDGFRSHKGLCPGTATPFDETQDYSFPNLTRARALSLVMVNNVWQLTPVGFLLREYEDGDVGSGSGTYSGFCGVAGGPITWDIGIGQFPTVGCCSSADLNDIDPLPDRLVGITVWDSPWFDDGTEVTITYDLTLVPYEEDVPGS